MSTLKNYDLRDEIKAYWSQRAETFDLQPGHEIFSEGERLAWHALLAKHLGPGDGRRAVDLACGTAVVSHLLDDLGFRVTGLDWSEAMLLRARAKAKTRGRDIAFVLGDAENTMEADSSADVIVNRHLVWTLVDPKAAFAEWIRVLKPSGTLLIVDGDFVNPGPLASVLRLLTKLAERFSGGSTKPAHSPGALADTHASILSRVYFSGGAKAEAVAALLAEAGFVDIRIDTDLGHIHRQQASNFTFLKALERRMQHRYAISARKPE